MAFINLNVESQIVHEKAHPHITSYNSTKIPTKLENQKEKIRIMLKFFDSKWS